MDRNDLISRSELIKEMCVKFYTTHYYAGILNVIYNAPAVEIPVARWDCYCEGQKVGYEKALSERPQGEWIDYDNTFYKCPDCGYLLEKCCPQCQNKVILPKGGADMRQTDEPDKQITIEEYMQSLKGEKK